MFTVKNAKKINRIASNFSEKKGHEIASKTIPQVRQEKFYWIYFGLAIK